MQTAPQTDYVALLKDTLGLLTKPENLVPLLVDALLVTVVGSCTLGLLFPPLVHGYTAMTLKVVRGQPVKAGDSFQGMQQFGAAFVLGLLMFLGFVVGSLAAGVGALVAAFVFTYAYCVQVERPGVGAVDAIKASFALARDHVLDTLVVWGIGLGLGTVLSATVVGPVLVYAFTALLTSVLYTRYTTALPASSAPAAPWPAA